MTKLNMKNFENEFNKQINDIIQKERKRLIIERNKERGKMNILNKNEEEMLEIFLKKYYETNNYSISGYTTEFPSRMKGSVNNIIENLKLNGYISSSLNVMRGWNVTLTPEALEYFDKKGRRTELFSILVNDEEKLLTDIIKIDNRNDNITEFLQEKIRNDQKNIFRGMIGTLKNNGLINGLWASNTIWNVSVTQAGRSYFERKELYNKNALNNNSTYINSTVFTGNITNSTINIDSKISNIQKQINEKCNDEYEKQELLELLEETKEIIENFEKTSHIDKRKKFFNKISNHLSKNGWFYAEIVNLLGQTAIKLLGL